MTTENEFSAEERVCVNCRHFKRRWNPVALLDLVFDDGAEHYRCTLNGVKRELNPITGRVRICVDDQPCSRNRNGAFAVCHNGAAWEPNQRLLKGRTNLLKLSTGPAVTTNDLKSMT